ncbi:hypothetical protein Kpol_364p9 [Vanderwaltozyma polyspora DSM 70294]|uniref:Dit2p n=1 Tax=Vanderwaltozyma polyspora (strain ATCC 22028 / DSM 70294 / BCRC 21397 / CBS 2163 / NBRC 10782 / NRRL Y-8283 / UCD 57-17) TaxID=436907 RepID=A7TSC5_VANPO|nr:uncharacterized protein Kpol_364p9 [Vanderwaltozyma polyspora DSM 70294]EDO14837.1 hypothetical protein Kpol_364p9 [Vanderwaltozyma polyspora DSM 70294]
MEFFIKFIIFCFVIFGVFIFKVVSPPLNFPRNIPTIPFYVSFLPIFYSIDQTELFELYLRKPLERYGAVKYFFGSRWNILVSKRLFVKQMFKNEDVFAKSGNQKKIPYSLLALYTGDNVISAHGEIWKTYRSVVTNGLQHFDYEPLYKNSKLFCDLIEKSLETEENSESTVTVGPLIQRLALANISQVVLGFDFGTLTEEKCALQDHLIRIKKQIFHPFFLTFPFFDMLPLPQRRKGFKDVSAFRNELVSKVRNDLINNYKFEQTTFTSSDLIRAYNNKLINYQQLTDNIVVLLVAGHENPQLAITTILYLLGKYHDSWQIAIRNEIGKLSKHDDLLQLPILNSFIFEALRVYPPLSIIINRCTTKTCRLGNDIVIPKGAYVGYHNYSTTHNFESWGDDSDEFNPNRWGKTIEAIFHNWKVAKMECTLPTFHGGKRACLGEKLALAELRLCIAEILKRFEWKLSKSWNNKMTPAGPLCPLNLKLDFKKIESE